MNPLRVLAAGYAVALALVTSLNYIPGLTDAQGRTFGLFALDVFDDALHAASALWAGLAAWRSTEATIFFFRVFGTLYCLDGLLGLAAKKVIGGCKSLEREQQIVLVRREPEAVLHRDDFSLDHALSHRIKVLPSVKLAVAHRFEQ